MECEPKFCEYLSIKLKQKNTHYVMCTCTCIYRCFIYVA